MKLLRDKKGYKADLERTGHPCDLGCVDQVKGSSGCEGRGAIYCSSQTYGSNFGERVPYSDHSMPPSISVSCSHRTSIIPSKGSRYSGIQWLTVMYCSVEIFR